MIESVTLPICTTVGQTIIIKCKKPADVVRVFPSGAGPYADVTIDVARGWEASFTTIRVNLPLGDRLMSTLRWLVRFRDDLSE